MRSLQASDTSGRRIELGKEPWAVSCARPLQEAGSSLRTLLSLTVLTMMLAHCPIGGSCFWWYPCGSIMASINAKKKRPLANLRAYTLYLLSTRMLFSQASAATESGTIAESTFPLFLGRGSVQIATQRSL